jgi:hypothetical protein
MDTFMNRMALKYVIVTCISFSVIMLVLSVSLFLINGYKPKIYFPNGIIHNWGIVNEGELVKHSFVFENRGKNILKVIKVMPTCSCMTSIPSKSILQPGESSEIVVGYKGRIVPLKKEESLEVVVVTNDPDNPYIKLLMKCVVHSKVFWFPNTISFYSKHGEGGSREVQLISDRTENFTIQKISASTNNISTTYEKNVKGFLCKVNLNPDSPKGNSTEKLIIDIQADPFNREIVIPIYIMVK